MNTIKGIHHITAIAGNAQSNYDFYSGVLGMRLVKRTVNFDDPGTYHFYFGDAQGSPGTILTFFPWEGVQRGRVGAGMASEIVFTIPANSLEFWKSRLHQAGCSITEETRFGQSYLLLDDPEGLKLSLTTASGQVAVKPWFTPEVPEAMALQGFHSTTLMVREAKPTMRVLTEVLGYKELDKEGNRTRFSVVNEGVAYLLDLVEVPGAPPAINAGGTNHHVAFRVADDLLLMEFRKKVVQAGLHITEKIDRNYFYSLYFREPGGILFELASDNPGFLVDEPFETLGHDLKLPPQYEPIRNRIEQALPPLKFSN